MTLEALIAAKRGLSWEGAVVVVSNPTVNLSRGMVLSAYCSSLWKVGKLLVYVDIVSSTSGPAAMAVKFHNGFHVATSTVTRAPAWVYKSAENCANHCNLRIKMHEEKLLRKNDLERGE